MYQIMIRVNKAGDLTKDKFQFLPEIDEETKQYHVFQVETKEEAMQKAKELLNDSKYGYSKFDLLVVEHIKFDVDTTIIDESDIIPPGENDNTDSGIYDSDEL